MPCDVVMVLERRNGPRQLRDHDDDDDFSVKLRTDRQTDTQTNADERFISATPVGVSNQ